MVRATAAGRARHVRPRDDGQRPGGRTADRRIRGRHPRGDRSHQTRPRALHVHAGLRDAGPTTDRRRRARGGLSPRQLHRLLIAHGNPDHHHRRRPRGARRRRQRRHERPPGRGNRPGERPVRRRQGAHQAAERAEADQVLRRRQRRAGHDPHDAEGRLDRPVFAVRIRPLSRQRRAAGRVRPGDADHGEIAGRVAAAVVRHAVRDDRRDATRVRRRVVPESAGDHRAAGCGRAGDAGGSRRGQR
ncbi:Uncharacterised protein [Clostridium sporogenes]|nr:Uncharacterised protein [Clostridium sporogenes]